MKRALKVAGVLLALLLLGLVAASALLAGPLKERILTAANEQLDADLSVGGVSLSLIRSFPSVAVRLSEVAVDGRGPHEGTRLADVGAVRLTVDLASVLGGAIAIEEIRVIDPDVQLVVPEEGAPNWEIAKSGGSSSEGGGGVDLALEDVRIEGGSFRLDDQLRGLDVALDGIELTADGDLAAARSRANADLAIASVSVEQRGRTLLDGSTVGLALVAEIDQEEGIVTLGDNRLSIDSLALAAKGAVRLPEGGAPDLDLTLEALAPSIASVLSIVPGVADGALAGMTTDGTLTISGFARGPASAESLPALGLDVAVVDGRYTHDALAEPVTDIQVDAHVAGPGGDVDDIVVQVKRAEARLAGNPISVVAEVRELASDLLVDLTAKGDVDLAELGNLVPRDNADELDGDVSLDVAWRGSVNRLGDDGYRAPKARGVVTAKGVSWRPADGELPVEVPTASVRVTPQAFTLDDLQVRAGNTDLSGSGRIDNLLAWALLGEDLVGAVTTSSRRIDLDQLTGAFAGGYGSAPAEEKEGGALRLPPGIDLRLSSTADAVVLRGVSMKDARIQARLVEQRLAIEDVSVGVLGGRVGANGTYDALPTQPLVDLALEMARIDIATAVETFPVVEKLAPIARRAVGTVTTELKLNGALDEAMSLILDSLDGQGKLVTQALRVEGSEALGMVAKGLSSSRFDNVQLDGVTALFSVEDGRVKVKPFRFPIGPISAQLGGSHQFDQGIDYDMDLVLPAGEFTGAASRALGSLTKGTPFAGKALGRQDSVKVGVDITGTVTKPKVSLDLQSVAASAGELLEEVVDEVIEEAIDVGLGQATAAAEQARTAARRAADQAKDAAYKAADLAKKQAYRAADRLVSEAKDPLAKIAAQAARTEARRAADRAFSDGKKDADSAWRAALKKADAQYDRAVAEGSSAAKAAPSAAKKQVKKKGRGRR